MVGVTSMLLYLMQRTRSHFIRRLDGPQSLSGRFGEEANLLLLLRTEPCFLGCPARSLVATLSRIPRYLCLV